MDVLVGVEGPRRRARCPAASGTRAAGGRTASSPQPAVLAARALFLLRSPPPEAPAGMAHPAQVCSALSSAGQHILVSMYSYAPRKPEKDEPMLQWSYIPLSSALKRSGH